MPNLRLNRSVMKNASCAFYDWNLYVENDDFCSKKVTNLEFMLIQIDELRLNFY